MKEYTKSYKDLFIWQRSHLLAKKILSLVKKLHRDETSQIIKNQITRSVTSAPANIVEGYYTRKGKQFSSYLERARGSLAETDYWALLLNELNYIEEKEHLVLSQEMNEIIRMVSALIQKTKF